MYVGMGVVHVHGMGSKGTRGGIRKRRGKWGAQY